MVVNSDESNQSWRSVDGPTFKGTAGEFQIFWTRWKAYARMHKFRKALRVDADMLSSEDMVIDMTGADGQRQQAAKERNKTCRL